MKESAHSQRKPKRWTPFGVIFAALGAALFAYFVQKAGAAQIAGGIKRLGAGFLLVLLISGVRQVVRALAWMRCFEAPQRLRFRDAFRASVTGDALGNLVPLGTFVSEPAKAVLVRERVPFSAGLAAIAVENLFYSLSVMLFIFSGTAALLLAFPLPRVLRLASLVLLAGLVVAIAVGYFIVQRQWKFASRALEYMYARGVGRRVLENRRERIGALEDRVYGFYARNQSRFLPILLLEACFHLAGVAEVYATLAFISEQRAPTVLTAFVLESVNRVINVVFKFVPLRVGVDEAGTGLLANVLEFGTGTGVTLAIVRKARVVCWTALGVAFLAARGLSLRAIEETAENAAAATNEARASRISSAVSTENGSTRSGGS